MEPIEIPDAFGGHLVFPGHVEPVNMPLYHRRIRERAMTYLEDELWRAIHVAEIQDAARIHREIAYRAQTFALVDREIEFLVRHDDLFQIIFQQVLHAPPAPLAPEPEPAPVEADPIDIDEADPAEDEGEPIEEDPAYDGGDEHDPVNEDDEPDDPIAEGDEEDPEDDDDEPEEDDPDEEDPDEDEDLDEDDPEEDPEEEAPVPPALVADQFAAFLMPVVGGGGWIVDDPPAAVPFADPEDMVDDFDMWLDAEPPEEITLPDDEVPPVLSDDDEDFYTVQRRPWIRPRRTRDRDV